MTLSLTAYSLSVAILYGHSPVKIRLLNIVVLSSEAWAISLFLPIIPRTFYLVPRVEKSKVIGTDK
jgi:hypothetical protein